MSSDIVYDPAKQAWCHLPSGACSDAQGADKPQLPTYSTIADVLEKKNGAGIRLLGWTAARTLLIAPFFRMVGVPWRQAFAGAILASCAISTLTLVRLSKAEYEINRQFLAERKWLKQRRRLPTDAAMS